MPDTTKRPDRWPDTLSKPKTVKWGGRSFYRGADTPYYRATFRRNGKHTSVGLHRMVWESCKGRPLPKGMEIHHKDLNPFNNHPSNLRAVWHLPHYREHLKERAAAKPGWWLNGLSKAREAAKTWHASKEGLSWHSSHGKRTWSSRDKHPAKCTECTAGYQTYYPTKSKFCSKKCFTKAHSRRYPEKYAAYRATRNVKMRLLRKQRKQL